MWKSLLRTTRQTAARHAGQRRAMLCGLHAAWSLALLPSLAQASGDVGVLRVAVPRSLAPPFVIWRENLPVAGLDVEIARALAAQLKLTPEFQVLPRLRVEALLAEGKADMACNLSPLEDSRREGLLQGPPLFELQDVLLGHGSAPPADQLDQLPLGAIVGTLQGQVYSSAEPYFLSGRLKRDDALDEDRLLRKLALNRHPYGISTRQTAAWLSTQEDGGKIASWRMLLGQRGYRCTLAARGRVEPSQFNAAVQQLQASTRLEKILADYTQAPVAVVVSVRSPVRDVSRTALTELFLGQRARLSDGSAPEPVMAAGPERQQFLSAVLQRDASQYRAAWAAQQFGGRRRAPTELRDAESLKSHLLANINAIGYLPLSLVDASLRVVYLP